MSDEAKVLLRLPVEAENPGWQSGEIIERDGVLYHRGIDGRQERYEWEICDHTEAWLARELARVLSERRVEEAVDPSRKQVLSNLVDRIVDVVAKEMIAECAAGCWVPLSDRFPEIGEPVLVAASSGGFHEPLVAQWDGEHFEGMGLSPSGGAVFYRPTCTPTHWMPLPSPPLPEPPKP